MPISSASPMHLHEDPGLQLDGLRVPRLSRLAGAMSTVLSFTTDTAVSMNNAWTSTLSLRRGRGIVFWGLDDNGYIYQVAHTRRSCIRGPG